MHYTVVISVDYESPPAHRVARSLWSALSRTALDSGSARITARWESLQDPEVAPNVAEPTAVLFVVGQDRPEKVEYVGAFKGSESPLLYGVVVATLERPSPLSGSLLYQGVGRLTGEGVRAGTVLPALIPVSPKTEGEAYAARLLQGMQKLRHRQR